MRSVFDCADRLDAKGCAGWFTPEGRAVFGNSPAAVGPAAIEAAVFSFHSILHAMKHTLLGVWSLPEGWCVEAQVDYWVKGGPAPVPVSGVTVFRTAGDRIADARVYYDLAPVFAAAQAARNEPGTAAAAPVLAVEHRVSGNRGAFIIERDGQRLAELAYTMAGDLSILEHTEVDGSLRGTGVGLRLVEAAVAWAREAHKKIMPLCPFARAVFARTPALRDVLAQ
ncbi:MAG TPA: N-acetyltransferase [Myxococcaceae bacterium]|nr:N-acetyltransferase [Myxococcaceae bacterium]